MGKHIENTDREEWDIEEAITNSGSYGLVQIFVTVLVLLFIYLNSYQSTILYYAADDPPWKCVSNNSSDFCKNHYGKDIEQSDPHFSQRCKLNRSEWKFTKDKSFSLVSEFELICEKGPLAAVTNSGFFIGWGVAGLIMGYLTDIYGRKIVICIAMFILSAAAISSSFITAVWQIILLRILVGAGYGSVNTCAYTLMTEVVGQKHRLMTASLYQVPNDWSMLTTTLIAYHVQHWRKLLLYTSLASILLVVLFLFLPESVRWLYAAQKYKKAEKLVKKIAKVNGKSLQPFKFIQHSRDTSKVCYNYIDLLCHHQKITALVVCVCFSWMANALIYYGYTLESSDLGGSIYFNFALSCIADLPTGLVAYFTCKWFGRKNSCKAFILLSCLTLVGLSIICFLQSNVKWIATMKIVFAMIGKGSISYSFAILYLWTFELYPTIVRSQGTTLCQISGRVGSAIAPFIATTLSEIHQAIPFILMASIAVITLFLLLTVPETKHLKTREKFEDFFINPSNTVFTEENVNVLPNDRQNLLSNTE